MANSNGDPLDGNRPRTDYNGFGEISDVCVKRKLRNRMQDLGQPIFVQSNDRCDDGCKALSERAKPLSGIKDSAEYAKTACAKWMDARSFGQVFAFKDGNVSVGVRGPVSIHQSMSASPVDIISFQITKSVNGEPSKDKENEDKRSSDTMGMKHMVRFGLYEIKGSISVQLVQKTGFTEEDAEILKSCLLTLFENDSSAARPDGSMEAVRLYWWRHNCPSGQYSTAKVHRSVHIELKNKELPPCRFEDYEVTLEPLEGLTPEILG